MQANAKTIEGNQHADRDAQFNYLNDQAQDHLDTGDLVISVDTKKKELVGSYKNGGRQWRPAGDPEQVKAHDFADKTLGKANPYGVYDIGANTGWVWVGTDHDTAEFAVNTIATWWREVGKLMYPNAARLMISADDGGSNGYRTRLWKTELAHLAAATGLRITVCHLPPGTGKWNNIEHRLFAQISMNWRGRLLTSHEVIVETIAATTTSTGLTVRAELDDAKYSKRITIPDKQIKALETQGILAHHKFHGEWNYTLNPEPRHTRDRQDQFVTGPKGRRPELTGPSGCGRCDGFRCLCRRSIPAGSRRTTTMAAEIYRSHNVRRKALRDKAFGLGDLPYRRTDPYCAASNAAHRNNAPQGGKEPK